MKSKMCPSLGGHVPTRFLMIDIDLDVPCFRKAQSCMMCRSWRRKKIAGRLRQNPPAAYRLCCWHDVRLHLRLFPHRPRHWKVLDLMGRSSGFRKFCNKIWNVVPIKSFENTDTYWGQMAYGPGLIMDAPVAAHRSRQPTPSAFDRPPRPCTGLLGVLCPVPGAGCRWCRGGD